MKKTIIKILIIIWLISSIFIIETNALAINIWGISWIEKITGNVIEKTGDTDIVVAINDLWFNLLRIAKIILQGLFIVFIVYLGWKMIMSMWSDDAELTKAKSQMWYSLIAVVFINIPWLIYESITLPGWNKIISWWIWATFSEVSPRNLFLNMNLFSWRDWVVDNIISAIQVFIFTVSVYIIIMAGIKIMTSGGKDEKIKEAKEKILYSIVAMLFVGFIEAWKQFAITWKISYWTDIFWKITDISLLFAGPIVMIFLTYAGYIYITANWEEEKVKKAKSIIINTLIATVLLIVMVTFLNDLITL